MADESIDLKRISALSREATRSDWLANTFFAVDNASIGAKKLAASILVTILNNFAKEFKSDVACVAGKCYWKDGVLYKCKNAHSGAWSDNDFEEATIDDIKQTVAYLLGVTATDADFTATNFIAISSASEQKKMPLNLLAKASEQAAIATYAQNVAAQSNTLSKKIDEIADVEISPNIVNPSNWMLGTKCILNDSMTVGQANEETNYIFLGTFPIGTELVFRGWLTGRAAVVKGNSSGVCVGVYRMPQEDFYETSLDGYNVYKYTTTTEQVGVYVDVRYEGQGTYVAKKSDYDRTHKCMAYGDVVSLFKGTVRTDNINPYAVTPDRLEADLQARTGKLLKSREVSLAWVDGYYWAGKKVPNESFSVSDPILIHGGETLLYYGRFGATSGGMAVQVDRLGRFIRGLKQGTGGYAEFEYTATVDDEWISFSKSKSNNDSVCYVYRTQDNDVRMTEEQLSKNDYYRFLFQYVDCIGASLTEGYMADQHIRPQYSYPTYLAKITGWNVRNLGVSGATATSWYNGHTEVDYSGTDAVFMMLGINGGLPDTYGEHLGDNTDYYCRILDKILSDNPDCRIFLFTLPGSSGTPIDVTNATLQKIADGYASQNVALCDFRDNPYYYMRSQSGGKANYEYHPSDEEGTHLGKIGYLTMARVLLSLAMRWIDTHRSNYELPYV